MVVLPPRKHLYLVRFLFETIYDVRIENVKNHPRLVKITILHSSLNEIRQKPLSVVKCFFQEDMKQEIERITYTLQPITKKMTFGIYVQ